MKFEVGKYYKAGSKTENFFIGSKLLCIDLDETAVRFYIREKIESEIETYWEPQSNCQDFTEWIEPRSFEIALCDDGRIFDPKYKPERVQCELIKVVEVK